MSHSLEHPSVLVTGGVGAIGSALCRRLLQSSITSLTIVDDLSSSSLALIPDITNDARVRFLHGSVTDDAMLDQAFASKPSIVFHLAANFANQNSVEHTVRDTEVNSIGTAKILDASHRHKVKKFIFASSSCVYGNATSFSVDTRDFHLDTPYAINKLHGEYLTRFYHEYHGMNATILRYFNSFGPGELPGPYRNVVPNFFALAMMGRALPITGTDAMARDFNFIENTVTATLLAAEHKDSAGKTYNVGSGKETPILEIATIINTLTGNTAGIERKPRRSWDTIKRRCADISLTTSELQYGPTIDLTSQLQATYKWLQSVRRHFPEGWR